MATSLLRARRFLPLFLTQGLGALNDNLFKNALVVLVLLRGDGAAPALVALAGGLFILPYVLFSALAGQLADRFDKPSLIRLTKWAELGIAACAAIGWLSGNLTVLMALLAALGIQAAFFSPLKYGILPEHLAEDERLRGNGLIEAGTFLAILAGTIAGGLLIGGPSGPALVAGCVLGLAVLGLLAAAFIPPAPAADPSLRVRFAPVAETASLLRAAGRNRVIWLCSLGLSWFWAVGAIFLTQFPVMARALFGGDSRVITLLLAAFVLGIGMGSVLAGRLRGSERAAHVIPFAGLLLSVFAAAFASLAASPVASSWTSPHAMVTSVHGAAALACLVATACCGGLFSVPLYALIQDRAAPAQRARMIAANNVLNAAAMAVAALAMAALAATGVGPVAIIFLTAGLNVLVALRLRRLLPDAAAPLALACAGPGAGRQA